MVDGARAVRIPARMRSVDRGIRWKRWRRGVSRRVSIDPGSSLVSDAGGRYAPRSRWSRGEEDRSENGRVGESAVFEVRKLAMLILLLYTRGRFRKAQSSSQKN